MISCMKNGCNNEARVCYNCVIAQLKLEKKISTTEEALRVAHLEKRIMERYAKYTFAEWEDIKEIIDSIFKKDQVKTDRHCDCAKACEDLKTHIKKTKWTTGGED